VLGSDGLAWQSTAGLAELAWLCSAGWAMLVGLFWDCRNVLCYDGLAELGWAGLEALGWAGLGWLAASAGCLGRAGLAGWPV